MTSGSRHEARSEERRGGTHEVVEELLAERREMLLRYEQVAGVAPFEDRDRGEDDGLHRFAQLLIDYIAAGHFALYQRIAEGRERRRAVRELAAELYPAIRATSEAVMAFNDAVVDGRERLGEDQLRARLAELGEQLARRVELEDRLISALIRVRSG